MLEFSQAGRVDAINIHGSPNRLIYEGDQVAAEHSSSGLEDRCRMCERRLPEPSGTRGRWRVFCSTECGRLWHRIKLHGVKKPVSCVQCGAPVPFNTGRGRKLKYCSRECKRAWENARNPELVSRNISGVCLFCSQRFLGINEQKYCSRSCSSNAAAIGRGRKLRVAGRLCACGKEIALANKKFCGPVCSSLAIRKARIVHVCEICGNQFSDNGDPRRANRCCSRKCGFELQRTDPTLRGALIEHLRVSAARRSAESAQRRGPFSRVRFYECAECHRTYCRSKSRPASSGRIYCSDACASAVRYRTQQEKNGVSSEMLQLPCRNCGKTVGFRASSLRAKLGRVFCSGQCSHALAARTRRARKKLGRNDIPSIPFLEVWLRSKGICHVCGLKCSRKYPRNHPLSVTIDHVMPLAMGGEHNLENVQIAHMICNSLKGDWLLVMDSVRERAKERVLLEQIPEDACARA